MGREAKLLPGAFVFSFFMAAPEAYGSSWASDQISATAAVYTTAMATLDLSLVCYLHHSLQQRWILNPLSEAKD